MNDRQIIKVPFTRIDEKKRMVYGYASTGRTDTYDTSFDPAWWPQAVIGYKEKRTLSSMHLDLYGEPQRETGREPMEVGTVPILECDDRGLWVGAEIRTDDAWEKILSGEYNGFSVAAVPFEMREEKVDGRDIVRFTKYQLSDITVGYPASNVDAVFQLVERLAVDADSPWDWDWASDADAIVNQMGWEGLAKACMYKDPDADPETKAAYKLPVMKMKAGQLTLYWNGVRAAMARLMGGGGKIDIPDAERKKIYSKLVNLYKKFDKEPPEFRLDNGGAMSKFMEEVRTFAKGLLGKEPDDKVVGEITAMETRLADEKAKEITKLTEAVTGLTARLEKLEKPDQKTTDPKDAKIEELSGTIATLAERLEAVEKASAKSNQPGEKGGTQDKGKPDMNNLIRARMGIKSA